MTTRKRGPDATGAPAQRVSPPRPESDGPAGREMECAAPDPEALAGVAAELAHEFNNLFAGVLGYIELLLDEFATGDPRRQDIEAIRRSIERAVALTSRLHAVASRRDGPRSA